MKTFKIFLKLCEVNLKKLFIFRAGFFISLTLMTIWVAAYVILIEVIFYHTDNLAGWDKGSILLIMSIYYIIQNISDMFFKDNFEDFGDSMRRGDLDFKIVKPAPTRLLAFFWEIRFDHAASFVPTIIIFVYALKTLTTPISLKFLLIGTLLIGVSLILYFSILSFIATLSFWVQRNDTFNMLIFNITQLSRYPRQIYLRIIGKILTFALPLALIASIPAEVALQFDNGYLPLYFVIITFVIYILGRVFWSHGLKKYTSAN